MNRKKYFTLFTGLLFAASFQSYGADSNVTLTPKQIPGKAKEYFNAPTSGYGDSNVQTHLRLDVKDNTKAIHFIRDNNDPYVITKTYELKNANPYALRVYLQAVLYARRVGENRTNVDALKFNDGRGLLIVSAEDYRFTDSTNGDSIDTIVEKLDKPGMAASGGRPKFIYFPKVNAAANLAGMVKNVGATGNDVEFESGVDTILVDGQLNALFIAAPFWSWKHIKEMVEQYDRPMPEVRISYKVVEIFAENDDKIGVDFQSWKNNDGADFFSAGGRYRNNWAQTFAGGIDGSHSSKTEFFNFNPKWNSKYIDFLTSRGKAKVVTSGVLLAKNRNASHIKVSSGLFYDDVSKSVSEVNARTNPHVADLNDGIPASDPLPTAPDGARPGNFEIEKGKAQITKVKDGFSFELTVNPVVTAKSTLLTLSAESKSLIGWKSDGSPRLSASKINTEVQIGNSRKDFIIGGIQKTEIVRGVAGLPFLKDLPGLGWAFSTETESTKKSQLVIVASAEYALPFDKPDTQITENIGKIVDDVNKRSTSKTDNLGFEQLWLDTDKIE